MSRNYNFLNKLTFKTNSYIKNFDLTTKNETFITEHEGFIHEVRIKEKKPPFLIGEYSVSVWHFGFARNFDVDLSELLNSYDIEDVYKEIKDNIDYFDLNNINNLIIIHNLVLHPNYRKKEVTEEFIEAIYRDLYQNNLDNKLIALVKPMQYNLGDKDYFFNKKKIKIREELGQTTDYKVISAINYYSLNNLLNKKDMEENEYKLFAVASKCGFKRINDSYLFNFDPQRTIQRIENKQDEFDETLF